MAAKAKAPEVSVIMPVLNEAEHLEAAVGSVLAQEFAGQLELLLALGPSKDETNKIAAKIARADPRIRLVENTAGLTTAGMNLCIKQAKADIIIRVDAHSELAPGYIKRGVELLAETGADELGGIMLARGRSAFQQAVAWAYSSRFGIGGAAYHVGGAAGEAESAYLGIFRADALARVGGYDESIIRGEDFAPPVMVAVVAAGLAVAAFGQVLGILPLAGYLAAVAALAVTAANLSLKARVALLVVLPSIHFSWGAGFWFGLLRGAAKTVDRSRVS